MTTRPTRSGTGKLRNDPLSWIEPPAAQAEPEPHTPDQTDMAQPASRTQTERTEDMPTSELAQIPAKAVADRQSWENFTAFEALNLLGNPIMVADKNMVIRFVNEAAFKMFENIEQAIRQDLPHFRARDVIGKSIDVFHKNPAYQRRIMDGITAPHDGKFSVGGKHLAFKASPTFNADSSLNAVFVEWQDRTALVDNAREVATLSHDLNAMVDAHNAGDIDTFMDPSKFSTEFATLARGVNEMVEGHIETKKKVIACATEFAEGNFDAPLEKFPRKKAFINVAMEQIRESLKGVTAEIERMSMAMVNGELDTKIATDKFNGSFRAIVEYFDKAFGSLNGAFSLIGSQVQQVAITVEQMTQSSQSLATNSQIQSTSVDEVSASAEQTDSQVKANAVAATTANQLVTGASVVAADGKGKMEDMVKAMEGIRVSSQDIAKIIKVIDEIAFQTNLLALNAAVEAARAGQHGRGFAVVAQEVRNLAGRSAKAARETSELIDDASTRVKDGVRIADEANRSFTVIADDIDKVRSLVREIATASEEQSRGVAQINVAIGEIARSALSTSQQADELASSAAEMQAATENMRNEVGRFRLRKVEAPRLNGLPSLDQMPAELIAQLQQMIALQMGAAAKHDAPRNGKAAAPTHRNTDRDERGFADF